MMRVVASRLQRASRPRPSVLVWLRDDAGRIGVGEASPLPPFSREDAAACERLLARAHEQLGALDDGAPPVEQALGL